MEGCIMDDFRTRTRLLLGDAAVERLAAAHVLVVGLGGVGGAAAEFIARAGVGRMTLVDGDAVESTNRNRQLAALASTLGRPKAEVMADRLRDINPEIRIEARVEFIRGEITDRLLEPGYDYAVDAIDSLAAKVEFIVKCVGRRQPLISSMGAGGRRDPGRIERADIAKTHGCALARAVRQRLRQHGVSRGVPVVFSPETVPASAVRESCDAAGNFRSAVGTISYLPVTFGAFCAAAVIDGLLAGLPPEKG